jgi:hypothetical protein
MMMMSLFLFLKILNRPRQLVVTLNNSDRKLESDSRLSTNSTQPQVILRTNQKLKKQKLISAFWTTDMDDQLFGFDLFLLIFASKETVTEEFFFTIFCGVRVGVGVGVDRLSINWAADDGRLRSGTLWVKDLLNLGTVFEMSFSRLWGIAGSFFFFFKTIGSLLGTMLVFCTQSFKKLWSYFDDLSHFKVTVWRSIDFDLFDTFDKFSLPTSKLLFFLCSDFEEDIVEVLKYFSLSKPNCTRRTLKSIYQLYEMFFNRNLSCHIPVRNWTTERKFVFAILLQYCALHSLTLPKKDRQMKTTEPLFKQLLAVRHSLWLNASFCLATNVLQKAVESEFRLAKPCYKPLAKKPVAPELRLAKPRYKLLFKNPFHLTSDWQSLACYKFLAKKMLHLLWLAKPCYKLLFKNPFHRSSDWKSHPKSFLKKIRCIWPQTGKCSSARIAIARNRFFKPFSK